MSTSWSIDGNNYPVASTSKTQSEQQDNSSSPKNPPKHRIIISLEKNTNTPKDIQKTNLSQNSQNVKISLTPDNSSAKGKENLDSNNLDSNLAVQESTAQKVNLLLEPLKNTVNLSLEPSQSNNHNITLSLTPQIQQDNLDDLQPDATIEKLDDNIDATIENLQKAGKSIYDFYRRCESGDYVKIEISENHQGMIKNAVDEIVKNLGYDPKEILSIDWSNNIIALKDGKKITKKTLGEQQKLIFNILKRYLEKDYSYALTYEFEMDADKSPKTGVIALFIDKNNQDQIKQLNQLIKLNEACSENRYKIINELSKLFNLSDNDKMYIDEYLNQAKALQKKLIKKIKGQKSDLDTQINDFDSEIKKKHDKIDTKKQKLETEEMKDEKDKNEGKIKKLKKDIQDINDQIDAYKAEKKYDEIKANLDRVNLNLQKVDDINLFALLFVECAKKSEEIKKLDLGSSEGRINAATYIREKLEKFLISKSWTEKELNDASKDFCTEIASLILQVREEYSDFSSKNHSSMKERSFTEHCLKSVNSITQKTIENHSDSKRDDNKKLIEKYAEKLLRV